MVEPQISVGIDIGGTRIKAVAVSPDGRILARRIEPTVDDVDALIEQVGASIQELAEADTTIGISAPGIAARNNRSIAWMRGRMEAVEGLDWQRRLNRNTLGAERCPCGRDGRSVGRRRARGVACSRAHFGDGSRWGRDRRWPIATGSRLGRAGHLGHTTLDMDGLPDIVGMPGSLEDCIGNHNLSERSGGRFRDTKMLVSAAESRRCRGGEVLAT